MQFKAGYIVDSVAKVITNFKQNLNTGIPAEQSKIDQINGLLRYVSAFDVAFPDNHEPDYRNLHPVLATLNNIITRGLPTRAPVLIEKLFCDINLIEANTNEFELNYPKSTFQINYETIFELLHIIEPGLKINRANYGGNPGSNLEWDFIGSHPFLKQILESQRDFSSINERLQGGRTVDFCFTSPYLHWNEQERCNENISRIFEVDGPHHSLSEYKYYDTYRDAIAAEEHFETIRFTEGMIREDNTDFEALIGRNLYQIFKKNFERKGENLKEYSLLFIPLAVARIQKTILEFLLVHPEIFEKETISIAIIERDFPCGAIAIQSLQELFENINAMLDDNNKLILPEISLVIFKNNKWVLDDKLHLQANKQDENFFKEHEFDIIIDHSILRRSNIYRESDFQSDKAIKIRSSHYFDTSFGNARRVYCSDLLHYKALVKKIDDGSYIPVKKYEKHINFFIQNIFRKVAFREGQLPIISRALQQKPVIGLLPTGGGKSLTFQLPSFLQPGLCLVVDPIKSLMEDQVRVLKQNWIDCCEFINSNLQREEKVKRLVDFRYGETMFLFVSPERFVMEDFRKIIHTIDASRFGLAFSYCVIDEVHCVSEWGHDFRTTYLMLGKNAQRFSKTKSGGPVSLIGLTATASFDVLTDIERELNIDTDDVSDAIISIDNTIRPELFFNVIENEIKYPTPILSQTLKDCIGVAKQSRIRENIENAIETLTTIDEKVVIKGLEQHFEEFEIAENSNTEEKRLKFKERIINIEDFNTYSDVVSVIFCPHTKGTFGVTDQASLFPPQVPMAVFENLNIENKGYFIGGDDKIKRETRQAAQKYFIDFMEGKINYMVCTKAFGMGLDKSNIRMIHHVNFSSSPESYVQEAGRAGRDKVKSICSVYIDSNIYYTIVPDFILKNKHLFETTTIRKMARDIFEYYNDFQNRISEKYFGTKEDLINNFNQIGIQLEDSYIREFNQDLSIHEFFHKNSFKGIETEIYQLDRLFNYKEGINKYRYKLIQDKYNNEFDDEVNFNLTINGDYSGSMFLNNSEGKAIGKLFTKATPPIATIWGLGANGVPNLEKTEQILNFISAEWGNGDREDQTLFEFLSNNVELELNGGLSLIEYFVQSNEQKFKFIVPVSFQKNELEKRIKSDFHLETLPMLERHDYSTTDFLETLKRFSVNFEDLILRIEEQWGRNFFDNPDFMEKRGEYKRLYYSDVNMADISKMIYRLHSIGFIDDYTIDYNLGLFTLSIVKKNKNYYIEKTYTHLLKYLSRSKSIEKRDEIKKKSNEMDVFKTIQLCVRTILEFTYDDIVKKRKDAVSDLFSFISDSIDLSEQKGNDTSYEGFWYNYYFKEEMYYYFNAKYARANYTIEGQPYSLLDDTEKGRKSSWETFEKFAKVLNEQASFISECKMMRGSCKRIWRTLSQIDEEDEFVLKILYAFATFGLSNKYYYEDAKNYLIKGFRVLYNQTDYKQLNSCINNFEKLLIDSTNNKDFILYLNLAKQCIMIEINRLYTKEIISQIKEK